MGQAYFLEGRKDMPVCFDYFFRSIPNKGGYVTFAGLDDVLNALETLHFTDDDIKFLKGLDFDASYIDFLKGFEFRGEIYSALEGEIVFPNCPLVRVQGTQFEAQLIETLLLNILNFESLVATKASRIRYVAGDKALSDFGFRRAHGPGAILAARAAMVGGFETTSNVYAALMYDIAPAGTMAHSFVESYDSELEAFRAFAKSRPHNCIFLVDTFDTLHSGVPNAIKVAKEMESIGQKATGIRLDSGDLAYLAKRARAMLDEAGLRGMKIVASNQLDEFVIKSLLDQGAPIDIFGVGTKLVTGQPDAALDGVYKLSMAGDKPRLKISETVQKITLPGIKQVNRLINRDGMFYGADAIVLENEQSFETIYNPFEPAQALHVKDLKKESLLVKVMENGKRLGPARSLAEIASYNKKRLGLLPEEYKRFENAHVYKIGVSRKLLDLRNGLVDAHRKQKNEGAFNDRYSK